MTDPALALLAETRKVLERYIFDGESCRDDIAEICQKIDDVLLTQLEAQVRTDKTRAAA